MSKSTAGVANMTDRFSGAKSSQEGVLAVAEYVRENYLGQPVAIWCMRYIYRGVVKYVGDDFIVLDGSKKCFAVETSGTVTGEKPEVEDHIPSDVIVMILAVEQIIQPTWVAYGLDL